MSVRPAWELRENGDPAVTWFDVRLAFADGAGVDLLAVVSGGCVSFEDVHARPPLSLVDLTELADWIEGPLLDGCAGGTGAESGEDGEGAASPGGARRARPAWPRGSEGRRLVAQEYRAAQWQGVDPVLAVMSATGHSRRGSLRLIAQARDAGYLTPRHAKR
ncbi:DUF6214 family protein [Streptomyces sp. NPDC005811]|uniref:DUF6214 family protein n=1 Tax=Streptomyces sp. NPDC005811 TaxID=3154565 RepID=UPI0033D65B33